MLRYGLNPPLILKPEKNEHTRLADLASRMRRQLNGSLRLAAALTPAARRHALKALRRSNVRYNIGRKIDEIYDQILQSNGHVELDAAALELHKRKWSRFEASIKDTWYRAYATTTGIHSADFVPEDIYVLYIEPALNDFRMAPYLNNKATFQLVHEKDIFVDTLVRNIDGFHYDSEFQFIRNGEIMLRLFGCDRVVVKPSIDSGGGKNIEVFEKVGQKFISTAGEELTPEYLALNYGRDFVIQEYVEQLDFFSQFNPSSVNTVRVNTYRCVHTDEILILNLLLKIGGEGSVVDNLKSGGVGIGIDAAGRFADYAVDKVGLSYRQLPADGRQVSQLPPVPKIERILETAKRVAAKLYNQRLLGLDICVTAGGEVKVIEVNMIGQETNFYQFSSGPLFHEKTDEIIEYCASRPRPESVYRQRCIYI